MYAGPCEVMRTLRLTEDVMPVDHESFTGIGHSGPPELPRNAYFLNCVLLSAHAEL